MTATAQPPGAAPPRRWGAGRIAALVIGIVLLVPGIGLLVGGGALLWANNSSRTADGFVLSGRDHFSAPGYALTSETLDLATGASWVPVSAALGRARVEVTADSGKDVFIGIAPVDRAQSYLSGVGHTVVTDIGAGGSSADVRTVAGGAPPAAPGSQNFWVAKASGTGAQQLTWVPSDGSWMLVVMNTDGSAGVSVQARAGATVPALGTISWTVLGIGIGVTAIGVLLIVLAARRRPGPVQATGAGVPAGPPGTPAPWLPAPRQSAPSEAPESAQRTDPGTGRPPD